MFSFSRNAFIIIDSDAVKKADGTVVDQSNFFEAKQHIKKQIKSLSQDGCSIGLWYSEGDTFVRTIEDYLDRQSIELVSITQAKKQKKRSAQIRVRSWDNKKLSDFPNGLATEIKILYESIARWQE